MDMHLTAIGVVHSPLTDARSAPKQGDEGAPEATIVLEPHLLPALEGLRPGDRALVLTWFDRADRDVLTVHPRGDSTRQPLGVFATRSPARPNPVGLHRVEIVAIDGPRVRVRDLEAFDGTPVLDIKPTLSANADER